MFHVMREKSGTRASWGDTWLDAYLEDTGPQSRVDDLNTERVCFWHNLLAAMGGMWDEDLRFRRFKFEKVAVPRGYAGCSERRVPKPPVGQKKEVKNGGGRALGRNNWWKKYLEFMDRKQKSYVKKKKEKEQESFRTFF